MRHRTKTHLLTEEQIDALLERAEVGRLGTFSQDGYPYIVPMHFVYFNQKIYMHGLPVGQKIDNIKFNCNVCFEIDEMLSLLYKDVQNPCDVNTEFNSIVVQGQASIVEDFDEKLANEYLENIFVKNKKYNLLVKGTNLQINVWKALLNLPNGIVATYSDIANYLDKPKAVRAVASAIARNHIGYLIPCHRVIGKSGAMSGYRW